MDALGRTKYGSMKDHLQLFDIDNDDRQEQAKNRAEGHRNVEEGVAKFIQTLRAEENTMGDSTTRRKRKRRRPLSSLDLYTLGFPLWRWPVPTPWHTLLISTIGFAIGLPPWICVHFPLLVLFVLSCCIMPLVCCVFCAICLFFFALSVWLCFLF